MTLDREITAKESAAQPQSQGQESRATEVPTNIPNLLSTIEENHLKVDPVKNEKGEVTGYDIKSRGNHQLFRVGKDDMTLAIVKDTVLSAAADREEIESNFDIIAGVQRSLKKLGMSGSEIPTTPHGIAQEAITLMEDFLTIQQKKSEIDIQNNLQGFLAMTMRVYIGGKKEYDNLPKPMQRLVVEQSEPLAIRALEQLGVGQGTVNTAESMRIIAEKMSEIRRDAGFWAGAGRVVNGIGTGANKLLLGEGGILEGVITNGDTLVSKAIERTAEVAGRAKTGVVTNWKANQNSKLEE